MRIVEVTWKMAFKVWWSITWRAFLFGLLGGVAIGIVFGILAVLIGIPVEGGYAVFLRVLGFFCGIAITIWAISKVLYKRYSDFSVVCIANEPLPAQPAQEDKPL